MRLLIDILLLLTICAQGYLEWCFMDWYAAPFKLLMYQLVEAKGLAYTLTRARWLFLRIISAIAVLALYLLVNFVFREAAKLLKPDAFYSALVVISGFLVAVGCLFCLTPFLLLRFFGARHKF
jgi:hypothetical protein